jgi:hypothetical protein
MASARGAGGNQDNEYPSIRWGGAPAGNGVGQGRADISPAGNGVALPPINTSGAGQVKTGRYGKRLLAAAGTQE